MTFGERLRMIREKAGLTQNQLAKKTGIHRNSIGGYERDVNEPSIFILCCLADVLGVSTDYLVGRKGRADNDE